MKGNKKKIIFSSIIILAIVLMVSTYLISILASKKVFEEIANVQQPVKANATIDGWKDQRRSYQSGFGYGEDNNNAKWLFTDLHKIYNDLYCVKSGTAHANKYELIDLYQLDEEKKKEMFGDTSDPSGEKRYKHFMWILENMYSIAQESGANEVGSDANKKMLDNLIEKIANYKNMDKNVIQGFYDSMSDELLNSRTWNINNVGNYIQGVKTENGYNYIISKLWKDHDVQNENIDIEIRESLIKTAQNWVLLSFANQRAKEGQTTEKPRDVFELDDNGIIKEDLWTTVNYNKSWNHVSINNCENTMKFISYLYDYLVYGYNEDDYMLGKYDGSSTNQNVEIKGNNVIIEGNKIGPFTIENNYSYDITLDLKLNGESLQNYSLQDNQGNIIANISNYSGDFYIISDSNVVDKSKIEIKYNINYGELTKATLFYTNEVDTEKVKYQNIINLARTPKTEEKSFSLDLENGVDLALKKVIVKVNDQDIDKRLGNINTSTIASSNNAEYTMNKTPVELKLGDTVTYAIKIFNEGKTAATASEIIDYLPYYLDVQEVWYEGSNGKVTLYSESYNNGKYVEKRGEIIKIKYLGSDEVDLIAPFENDILSSQTIYIKCKVYVGAKGILTNMAEITKYQINNENETERVEIETDRDSTAGNWKKPSEKNNTDEWNNYSANQDNQLDGGMHIFKGQEDDDDFEKVKVQVLDLSLTKRVVSVNNPTTGENTSYPNRLVSIVSNNLKNGRTDAEYNMTKRAVNVEKGDIVRYKVAIYNESKVDGEIREITDYLPKGLKYADTEFNKQQRDEKITYNEENNTILISIQDENYRGKKIEVFDGNEVKEGYSIEFECEVTDDAEDNAELINVAAITAYGSIDYKGDYYVASTVGVDIDSDCASSKLPTIEKYKQKIELLKTTSYDLDFAIDKNITNDESINLQDDDDFERLIVKKSERKFDLALRKNISKITPSNYSDRTEIDYSESRSPKIDSETLLAFASGKETAVYKHSKKKLKACVGDIVTYQIRVYNEGEESDYAGYASEITDYLPKGLKFIDIAGAGYEVDTNKSDIDNGKIVIKYNGEKVIPGGSIDNFIYTKETETGTSPVVVYAEDIYKRLCGSNVPYSDVGGKSSEDIYENAPNILGIDSSSFVSAALWKAGYEQFATQQNTSTMKENCENGTYYGYGLEVYYNDNGTIKKYNGSSFEDYSSLNNGNDFLQPGDVIVRNGCSDGRHHTNIFYKKEGNKYLFLDCGLSDNWQNSANFGGTTTSIWASGSYLIRVPNNEKLIDNQLVEVRCLIEDTAFEGITGKTKLLTNRAEITDDVRGIINKDGDFVIQEKNESNEDRDSKPDTIKDDLNLDTWYKDKGVESDNNVEYYPGEQDDDDFETVAVGRGFYSVNIEKVDSKGNVIKDTARFCIDKTFCNKIINTENGEIRFHEQSTYGVNIETVDGIANIAENIQISGSNVGKYNENDYITDTYTIEETKAPAGYNKFEGKITLKVAKKYENGLYKIDKANTTITPDNSNVKLEINEDTGNITIKIPNEEKSGNFKLKLVKYEKDSQNTLLEGAVFNISITDKETGNEIYTGNGLSTNSKGEIETEGIKIEKEGIEYTVKIEETEAPFGYVKSDDIEFTAKSKLGDDGNYVLEENTPQVANARQVLIENNKITVDVENTKTEESGYYQVRLVKRAADTQKVMSGFKFNATMQVNGATEATDLGELESTNRYVTVGGTVQIGKTYIGTPDVFTVQEVDSGNINGYYTGITEPIQLTVTKKSVTSPDGVTTTNSIDNISLKVGENEEIESEDSYGNTIKLVTVNVDGKDVNVSARINGPMIILTVENPKATGKFGLNLTKYEKGSTTTLSGAKFTVKINDGTKDIYYKEDLETNEKGKIEISDLEIASAEKEYKVTIEETQAPSEDYIPIKGPIVFTAKSVLSADKKNFILDTTNQPTDLTNAKSIEIGENEISVEVENSKITKTGEYNVELVKKGTDGTLLGGVIFNARSIVNDAEKEEDVITDNTKAVQVGASITIGDVSKSDTFTITEKDIGNNPGYYMGLNENEKIVLTVKKKETKKSDTEIEKSVSDIELKVGTTKATKEKVGKSYRYVVEKTLENGQKIKIIAQITSKNLITITVENPKIEGAYNLKIKKINPDNKTIFKNGVKFTVSSKINDKQQDDRELTLSNSVANYGKVQITKNGQIDEYTISEIYLADKYQGYIKLKNPITMYVVTKEDEQQKVYKVDYASFNKDNKEATTIDVELENGEKREATVQVENNEVTLIIPNIIDFDLSLRKFITKIGDTEINRWQTPEINTDALVDGTKNTAEYYNAKQPLGAYPGEIITYTLRVYNEGKRDGYANKIVDYLPEGLEFVTYTKGDGSINDKYEWTVSEDGRTVTTEYLSKANGKNRKTEDNQENPNLIKAFDSNTKELNYREVQIQCKVSDKLSTDTVLTNIAEITEYEDGYSEDYSTKVVDKDSPNKVKLPSTKEEWEKYKNDELNEKYVPGQEDDDDFEKVKVQVFDLSLRKYITGVNDTAITNRVPKFTTNIDKNGNYIYEHTKTPVEVFTKDIVTYTIRVYNEGTTDGYVSVIEDDIPEGLQFVEYKNGDGSINDKYKWVLLDENKAQTDDVTKAKYIQTDYLSKNKETKDGANLLKAFNKETMTEPNSLYVEVQFRVITPEKSTQIIENKAQIMKHSDKDGKDVKDSDSTPGKWVDTDDDQDVEYIKLKYFDLALRKYITTVKTKDSYGNEATNKFDRVPKFKITEDGKYVYEHDKTTVEVCTNDIVTYTIAVYNEGTTDGYASIIKDDIPEGLEFVQYTKGDGSTNDKYGWELLDEEGNKTQDITKAKYIQTDYLSKAKETNAGENLLKAFDIQTMKQPNSLYVEVEFKVNEPETSDREITNYAQIADDTDENGNPVKDIDSTPNEWIETDDDQDTEKVKVKYFDLSLLKWVSKTIVVENGKQSVKETGHTGYENPEPVVKVDLAKTKLDKVTVKFEYQIKVTNEGEIPGYVKEISDYIPEGLKFVANDNPEWKEVDGKVVTDAAKDVLLQPGESTQVSIILTWINSKDNLGVKTNVAEISKDYNSWGTKDIDSTPDNKVPDEDDIDDAKVMLTVRTGEKIMYIGLTVAVIGVICLGVFGIKKYVMK